MQRLFASLSRFARETRAAAAVEFAGIAFPMAMTAFGFVEISDLVQANRRAETAAASLADVVARDTRVTNGEITDIFEMLDSLTFPASPEGLAVRVASVQLEDNVVLWGDGSGMGARAPGSTAPIPSGGAVCPGVSAIFAESEYTYTPKVGILFGFEPIVLRAQQISCPRVIDPIQRAA